MNLSDLLNYLTEVQQSLPDRIDPSLSFYDQVLIAYAQQSCAALKRTLFGATHENLAPRLETQLLENWQMIQNNFLTYNSLPEAPCSIIWYKAALLLQQLSPTKKESVLQWLIPNLYIKSNLVKEYPNLTPENSSEIINVFKTHSLGDHAYHLTPAGVLTIFTTETPIALTNPYYNTERTEDVNYLQTHNFLTIPEIRRLDQHSEACHQVIRAWQQLESLQSHNNTKGLHYHLTELIKELRRYDAHAGSGTKEEAGLGTFPAIQRFQEYYNTLSPLEIEQVPQEIRDEIDNLIAICTNPQINKEAGINELCSGNRREKLANLLDINAANLAQIGLSDAQQALALTNATQQLREHANELKHQLAHQTYEGSNKLPLSYSLIQQLQLSLHIHSLRDMHYLLSLLGEDIHQLLQHNNILKEEILTQIWNIDSLVLISIEAKENALTQFFQHLGVDLIGQHGTVASPLDLAQLFISLPAAKVEIIMQACSRQIDEIVNSNQNVVELVNYLNSDNCRIVLKNISHKLIPTTACDLYSIQAVLYELSLEHHSVLLKCHAESLRINVSRSITFFSSLARMLWQPNDFTVLLDIIKPELTEQINTVARLNEVAKQLPSPALRLLFSHMKPHLLKLILSASDFVAITDFLTADECWQIAEKILCSKDTIITEMSDVIATVAALNNKYALFQMDLFSALIKRYTLSLNNLSVLMNTLYISQCNALQELLSAKIKRYVTCPQDLSQLIQQLQPSNTVTIKKLTPYQSFLHQFIADPEQLDEFFSQLPPSSFSAAFYLLITPFPDNLNSARTLGRILSRMSIENCIDLLRMNKKILMRHVQTTEAITQVLQDPNLDMCRIILSHLEPSLPTFIQVIHDLLPIMHHLAAEKCQLLCASLGKHLVKIGKIHVAYALNRLESEKVEALLRVLEIKVEPDFWELSHIAIINPTVLGHFINCLDEKKCTLFLQFYNNSIKKMLTDAPALGHALAPINIEKYQFLLAHLPRSIAELSGSASDFEKLMHPLTPGQRSYMLPVFLKTTDLENMIQSADALTSVLRYLEPHERRDILTQSQFIIRARQYIDNAADLGQALTFIEDEDLITALFDQFNNSLRQLLQPTPHSKPRLWPVLKNLRGSEQCLLVLKQLQPYLTKCIANTQDLANELIHLRGYAVKSLLDILSSQGVQLLSSWNEITVLASHHELQSRLRLFDAVCNRLMRQMNGYTGSREVNFNTGLENNYERLINAMHGFIPALIKHSSDFTSYFDRISENERIILYQAMHLHANKLFTSAYNSDFFAAYQSFHHIFTCFSRDIQITALKLIKSSQDFSYFMAQYRHNRHQEIADHILQLSLHVALLPCSLILCWLKHLILAVFLISAFSFSYLRSIGYSLVTLFNGGLRSLFNHQPFYFASAMARSQSVVQQSPQFAEALTMNFIIQLEKFSPSPQIQINAINNSFSALKHLFSAKMRLDNNDFLIHACQDLLPQLIATFADFKLITEQLNDQQLTHLMPRLGPKLASVIVLAPEELKAFVQDLSQQSPERIGLILSGLNCFQEVEILKEAVRDVSCQIEPLHRLNSRQREALHRADTQAIFTAKLKQMPDMTIVQATNTVTSTLLHCFEPIGRGFFSGLNTTFAVPCNKCCSSIRAKTAHNCS